jgi:hypothetical protein
MKFLTIFVLLILALEANAANRPLMQATTYHSLETFKGPDRTITWKSWQEQPGFRIRTGDRYLGDGKWDHYLCFERNLLSTNEFRISMIHLANESAPDVVIAPNRRYAIVKITNARMTVRKGRWYWSAQKIPFANPRTCSPGRVLARI